MLSFLQSYFINCKKTNSFHEQINFPLYFDPFFLTFMDISSLSNICSSIFLAELTECANLPSTTGKIFTKMVSFFFIQFLIDNLTFFNLIYFCYFNFAYTLSFRVTNLICIFHTYMEGQKLRFSSALKKPNVT